MRGAALCPAEHMVGSISAEVLSMPKDLEDVLPNPLFGPLLLLLTLPHLNLLSFLAVSPHTTHALTP